MTSNFALIIFYRKLLRIPDTLTIPLARTEAKKRLALMEAFLKELKYELT